MHGRLPDLGREVAADSTAVETFCNPNRDTKRGEGTVSDPEAGFTKKNLARAHGPRKREKDGKAERSATGSPAPTPPPVLAGFTQRDHPRHPR